MGKKKKHHTAPATPARAPPPAPTSTRSSISSNVASNAASVSTRGNTSFTGSSRSGGSSSISRGAIISGSQPISVGQYCTLTRAKELGIFNETTFRGSTTRAPFGSDYGDLKTYKDSIDSSDNRLKTLCKTVIQGADPATATTEAYPHCIDVKGPGFVKRANSAPESPYQCQAYDCPTGFSPTGEFCNKEPMYKDALIDKRSHCDERWYDWFMLPNYHLGNKYYEESIGKCYVPCPDKYVPYFVTDPVDGSKMGFFGENKLLQCVPKTEYFAGKYANSSDYCPLAWIYRLYTCNKDNAKQLIQRKRDQIRNSNKDLTTTVFATSSSEDNANKEALYISAQSQKIIENVALPTGASLQACNSLNTKERLDTAYMICDRLNKEGSLNLTGGEDAGSAINTNRNAVLRQACNAVFCNEQVGSLDIIAKPPICFTSTKTIDPASATTMSNEKPSQPDYSSNEQFMYKSFIVTLFIVSFLVGGMVLYIIFTRFIWPYTRWFFYKLLGLFTGRRYVYVQYKANALEEIARARSRAAAAASY